MWNSTQGWWWKEPSFISTVNLEHWLLLNTVVLLFLKIFRILDKSLLQVNLLDLRTTGRYGWCEKAAWTQICEGKGFCISRDRYRKVPKCAASTNSKYTQASTCAQKAPISQGQELKDSRFIAWEKQGMQERHKRQLHYFPAVWFLTCHRTATGFYPYLLKRTQIAVTNLIGCLKNSL